MTYRRLEYAAATSLALVALVVYIMTLAPAVTFIDAGELATDIYTLGVAHPTGYPLFTMIGYLFTHIPAGMRVIVKANLMAAFLCAAGLFFFFRFMLFALSVVSNNGFTRPRDPSELVRKEEMVRLFFPAAAATLTLAFSETYWSQALSIEVYSLHLLFLSLLLYVFSRTIVGDVLETAGKSGGAQRSWVLFAFLLGLAFTNHMTTILLAPAFLAGFFAFNSIFRSATWRKLGTQVVPFLLGLSAYLYLPLRASMRPEMNWGNPVDAERFLWHVSGKVYRVWIFSSFDSAGKQFRYFLSSLPGEFAYVPLVLAVLGIVYLFTTNRKALVFTALLFLGCIGYAINYDIHDIDSYFLLAYLTVALWCGFGVMMLVMKWRDRRNALIAGIALMSVWIVVTNEPKVDQRDAKLVEEYSRDLLGSIEPNGIVLSYQWDYFVSAAYYLQLVEGVRPDVVVIDKELLRRTWYLEQLEHRYPWLVKESKGEIDAFKAELYKFEHGLPYNASTIEYRYAQVIKSFFARNIARRPVYVTPEIEPQYYQGFAKFPSGLAFRLYEKEEDHQLKAPAYTFTIPRTKGVYEDGILTFYAQSYLNYAIYANSKGMKEQAKGYLTKALSAKPDYAEALEWGNRAGIL